MRFFFLSRFFVGLLTVVMGLIGSAALAQAPIGRWQLHLPGNRATNLAIAGRSLYIGGSGLFRYNLDDQTVRGLSRQDGFADVVVAAMAYDTASGQLVVGYSDANLDILDTRTGRITNLSDIQRKTITGSKRINSINAVGSRAYLACSFGIVVVDLERLEVADTYANLGPGGQVLDVKSTAVYHDNLFAATDQGILIGGQNTNLLDFANWSLYPGTQKAQSLATTGDRLYAVRLQTGTEGGLYRFGGNGWQLEFNAPENFVPTTLTASRGLIVMGRPGGGITTISPTGAFADYRAAGADNIYQALRGPDGQFYLADPDRGLFVLDPRTGSSQQVVPNGPVGNVSFFTLPVGADTYALTGGYSQGTSGLGFRLGFSLFRNGRWENTNRQTYPDPTQYPADDDRDFSSAAWNPTNNKLYLASYGDGLLEWGGPGSFRSFDASNSLLQSPLPRTTPGYEHYTRLKSVVVDAAGLVWMTNYTQNASNPGLFSFDPKTAQFTAHLAGLAPQASAVENLVIDDNGYKWMTIAAKTVGGAGNGSQGLIVYDDTRTLARTLTTDANSGGLLEGFGYVAAIAKDQKGDIWIGTAKGIQVFYNTASVFPATNSYKASQPIIDRRPLLDGQQVRAIAVDGGNRKWVGTDDGLWLFSEDGTEALANFTTANSPLPSNKITSLSVNGVTGEVFIGTEVGLATFRGTATEPSPEENPACTKVFPNPVPARFQGQIAIDGLTGGATVKITDVAGQLVYETIANGGRAVWNARDYNGQRVRSGIYLAYSANADGKNTCVSKIAVMGE